MDPAIPGASAADAVTPPVGGPAFDASFVLVIGALVVCALVAWVVATRRALRRLRVRTSPTPPLVVPAGRSGATIALHHLPAASRRFTEPVIVCHGMGVNRFSVDPPPEAVGAPPGAPSLARALADAGFDVWVLELRGAGLARVPRGLDWSIDDEALEDVPAAIAAVRAATGAERVWWVGHSKGGILQYVLHASGHPEAAHVAGLVTIGSPGAFGEQRRLLRFTTPLGHVLVWTRLGLRFRSTAPLVVPIIALVRRVFGPVDPLLRELQPGALQPLFASMFEDVRPATLAQTLYWVSRPEAHLTDRRGGSYDAGLARLDKPLLLLSGAADRLAPSSAIEHVAQRSGSPDVRHVRFAIDTGYSHDYGHGDLVLGARAPSEVFPEIVSWLEARVARA